MTTRYIFIAIVVLLAPNASSNLKGDKDAVCPDIRRYHGLTNKNQWDRYIPRYMILEKCCPGYAENNGTCEPQCSSGCPNGYCSKPDECSCDDGYEETDQNTCVPICQKICISGKCVSPDKCACNEGYKMNADGFTCDPVCSSSCENGFCSEPNVCECHPGYKRNDVNECEPICELGCKNGKCIDKDTCACDHGYQTQTGNNSICVPKCKRPCEFGTCSAPDKCTCDEGYKAGKHPHICEPECQSPCRNGWCSAPYTCRCNQGYEQESDNGECVPICYKPCKNSACVAPNTCACFKGYEKSREDDSVCQPRCIRLCSNGKCTAPETCSCDVGHRLSAGDKYICEPICDTDCENGHCAKPNVCECNRGYKKNATNACEPVCDKECINGKCIGPNQCLCNDGFRQHEDNFYCAPVCTKRCEPGASCTAPETCTCDEDFVRGDAGNGICVSACKPSCKHGDCKAMKCECSLGWGGESCDQPLLCVVTPSIDSNSTEPDTRNSQLAQSDVTDVITDKNRQYKWKWPSCRTKCLDQLNSTAKKFSIKTGSTTRHFIPIESSCNVEVDDQSKGMSGGATAAVVIISVFAIAAIIGGLIFMRIRIKPREDYSTARLVNDCAEVNETAPSTCDLTVL